MIDSYSIDLRVLFRKFYCHRCGERMLKKRLRRKFSPEEQKQYYKALFPHGKPIKIDVAENKEIFVCNACGLCKTTDEQLRISKLQKKMGKRILSEEELEI